MSPRPRTVDDATILDAATRVLGRIGSERLTLADVGAEAGLSAATLVQRFGSKRELKLSLMRHETHAIDERFVNTMAASDSPLEALFSAAADRFDTKDGPIPVANRLAFVLGNMEDAEFRALAVEDSRRAVQGYKQMIEKAVAAGELVEGYLDSTQLAQTIHATSLGSLVTWSISPNGNLRSRVRRDLDVLLRPFRRGPRKAAVATTADETERGERHERHDRSETVQFADRSPRSEQVEYGDRKPDQTETTF